MRPKTRQVCAWPVPQRAGQGGFVLPYALFVTVLILILGLSFMQTSAVESLVATRNAQRLQATAAAEYGAARARAMADSQYGRWNAMTYNGALLAFGASSSYSGHNVCTLFTNQTVPSNSAATYSVVIEDWTGSGSSNGAYRIHGYGTVGNITRHVSLDSQSLTYASFGWLTNSENDVWFRTGDSLSGLIWSNDQFNVNGTPTFNGHADTGSGSVNWSGSAPTTSVFNQIFTQGLTYNAPTLNMSSVLNGNDITAIQTAANTSGISEPSNGGNGYILTFNSGGTFTIQKASKNYYGQITYTTVISSQAISSTNGAFYFQDDVQVSGTVKGQVTVATSSGNDITIVNNLQYAYPSNPATMFQSGFNQSDPLLVDKCALVSGGDVVINVNPNWSSFASDMYITASIASVTGSFSNSDYTSSPTKTLHVYGGIAQMTRGAVGQVSGNGFLKDYHYDTRFTLSPPPFLPKIGAQFSNWQLY